MAKKQSAGLLLYRLKNKQVEVLLVHPGGPFWAKKDKAAWSIPKGEFTDEEDPLTAAKREFSEELGQHAPEGKYQPLEPVKQSGGKVVSVWSLEADLDITDFKSSTFTMEWPPKSKEMQEFPEIDKASWFPLPKATQKIHKGQLPFLEQLAAQLNTKLDAAPAKPAKVSPLQTSLF